MKTLLVLTLFLNVSCASSKEFKRVAVSNEEMKWRICNKDKDREDLHHKGFCYIAKFCKDKFFGKDCRNEQLFCAWGDLECLEKWELFSKKLISEKFDQVLQ